jgi:hypothetical protein
MFECAAQTDTVLETSSSSKTECTQAADNGGDRTAQIEESMGSSDSSREATTYDRDYDVHVRQQSPNF